MSTPAPTGASPASRLGVKPGSLVQSIGDDEGADEELLNDIVAVAGDELVPEDSDDVVDIVLLWWRESEDTDALVDALVDARRNLSDTGVVWLLTPKTGRDGHVEASDIQEAVPTAGMSVTSTVSAAPAWTGSRLVARGGGRH
ncbi:MAG TPA: DUF3052 domain-containing protein [Mycobacteriales bacterium]|nr:DUF3052 domain-containing protein [Mycobacteriales bacterium]